MTKARDLANFNPTNITDTGTEGTKVASGTTAQRGSTAGQIRFNSDTGLAEYYDGADFKSIDSVPFITSISPTEVASLDSGDETFTITGSFFSQNAVVKLVGNDDTEITASSVTVNSGNSLTAVFARSSFSNTKEPYDVKVINISGLTGIKEDLVTVDNTVSWNTASGSIASILTTSTGTHVTVSATDPDGDTITYSEIGGTVLTTAGLSLNSSTGAISGQPNSAGTLNFTLRASANGKTADRAFSILVSQAVEIDYLVLAGGGGGGYGEYHGGGGGAGGYRNSYNNETSGRGSSAETKIGIVAGTVLTVTVGAGGAGGNSTSSPPSNGSDSSISGSGLTTITSIGGGASGGYYTAQKQDPADTSGISPSGGCGGGGASSGAAQVIGGAGTANQGYDGGDGERNGPNYGGGGGGGTGSTGGTGTTTNGGNGGSGLSSSISGSSVTRGGGGGGATYSGGTGGSGGSGGGGAGGTSGQGSSASANSGGGGGGSERAGSLNGGNGASGVVILRLPTTDYTGTYTGTPSVSTSGSDTILVFNSSGSYTT